MYAQTSDPPNRSSSSQESNPSSNNNGAGQFNTSAANGVGGGGSGSSSHPQLHLHMFCPCAHPYYNNYRPPPVLSLPLHQLPRPYLQHYQYTQFNVNPYNFPLHGGAAAAAAAAAAASAAASSASNTSTAYSQISAGQGPNVVALTDFGPPPKDRRNMLDNAGHVEIISSARDDDILNEISHHLQQQQDHVAAAVESESFTKYLEDGLIQAEKIAIRNQHRPCFKNIQNLCNRTRGEILKTSSTYSNIHSQGIPWATKDFIYAFVRLINCWHMLKGYLDSKNGTLGNIDRELTVEFKATYAVWEKDTRDLAEHMVRVFTNLDNNVSSPNPNLILYKKPTTATHPPNILEPQNSGGNNNLMILQQAHSSQTDMLLNKVTSGTRLMINTQIPEQAQVSESPETSTTPRDEDSDNESRVYMKPGSYNIPKKNNSSDNSSRSYEFLETAQNVSGHFKKSNTAIIAQQQVNSVGRQQQQPMRNENEWRNAISASSNLINLNSPQVTNNTDLFGPDLFNDLLEGNVEQRGADPAGIERWLEQSNFDKDSIIVDESSFLGGDSTSLKPITLLQRVQQQQQAPKLEAQILDAHHKDFLGNYLYEHQHHQAATSLYNIQGGAGECSDNISSSALFRSRKLGPLNDQPQLPPSSGGNDCLIQQQQQCFVHKAVATSSSRKALYEHERGGLYSATVCTLERLIKILEQEDLAKRISVLEAPGGPRIKPSDFHEQQSSLPQTLSNVWQKIHGRKYYFVNECVRDIKNIIASAALFYEENVNVLNEIENFSRKLQECLELFFPGFDFSGIAGGVNEVVGPLIYKPEEIAEQHKV